MKKLIIKLDRFILDHLTEHIKRWIAKHKFEKHKVDFMIKTQWIEMWILIVWGITIPVILYIVAGQIMVAGIHFGVWSLLVIMRFVHIQWLKRDMKVFYDQLFSMRKNPIYYQMHKEVLEQMFVKGRRDRIITSGFLIGTNLLVVGLLTLLSVATDSIFSPNQFVAEFLLISMGFSLLDRYNTYVFDFDEPKPKEKKKKASLTDLVLKEWQRIVEGLSPQPNFGT